MSRRCSPLDLMGFHCNAELLLRLSDLSMDGSTDGEIAEVYQLTMTAPHIPNLPIAIEAQDLLTGIVLVEGLASYI